MYNTASLWVLGLTFPMQPQLGGAGLHGYGIGFVLPTPQFFFFFLTK